MEELPVELHPDLGVPALREVPEAMEELRPWPPLD